MNVASMRIDQLRSKDVFFHLIFDRPAGVLEIAERGRLHLGTLCRHCDKEVMREDADVIVGYWTPVWFIAHKDCVRIGKSEEAYACQKIDADCNDCRHFQRQHHNKRFSNQIMIAPKTHPPLFTGREVEDAASQRAYIVQGLMIGSYDGHCNKFDMPTAGWPNQSTGKTCFIHRKDAVAEG